MEKDGQFADYEDAKVYAASQTFACESATLNFVVEFGKDEAQIAFDVKEDQLDVLLSKPKNPDRPIRWM